MDSTLRLRELCREVSSDCLLCNNCVRECLFLRQTGEDIAGIARRGPSVEEAYACSLCGLCEAVCPAHLSLRRMFGETRNQAVEKDYISIADYRYMFPDRKMNMMKAYREFRGIHYDDLTAGREGSVGFFPGCTMLTYSPELTRTLFCSLKKVYGELTLLQDCCGLPLYQLGLQKRGDDYLRSIKAKLRAWQVKSIVIACPNCYYQLRPILQDTENKLQDSKIEVLTIFEALKNTEVFNRCRKENQGYKVTVHDSCPDRFYGIFARQARAALLAQGCRLVEMEHHHERTVCCGSGGQVSHSRADLAEEMVKCRLEEAQQTGATVLAGYCLGCVLNFARIPNAKKMKIRHVCDLLLGLEADYCQVKAKAKKIFNGPAGEELWEKIMNEE